MSNSTNRTPYTVPLTSTERRYIQQRIDLELRQQGRHIRKNNSTDGLDFEKEVEAAIAYFEKKGGWLAEREVPRVAVGALVGA